jgi:hypothetical protein
VTTEDDDSKTEPTFTRAQMAKMVAAQVREKLAAALSEYGDLDELKRKAAEADKSKSQLDRIEEQLKASEARAAKAERDGLIREVADELGIPLRLAKRLEGGTRAELLADGRDTMEELGIKPNKGKAGTTRDANEDTKGDGTDSDDGTEDEPQQQDEATSRQTAAATRTARPRENLRGGAPRTDTKPEETDPMKLVENIPRR